MFAQCNEVHGLGLVVESVKFFSKCTSSKQKVAARSSSYLECGIALVSEYIEEEGKMMKWLPLKAF